MKKEILVLGKENSFIRQKLKCCCLHYMLDMRFNKLDKTCPVMNLIDINLIDDFQYHLSKISKSARLVDLE